MTKLTKIEQNIQAILFAAGEPYEKERLAKLLEIDRQTLEQLVADLKAKQEAEQQKQNLINEIKTYDSNYDGTGKTLEQLQSA